MSAFIVRLEFPARRRGLMVAEYIGTYAARSPLAALCKAGKDTYCRQRNKAAERRAAAMVAVPLPADEFPELTARQK